MLRETSYVEEPIKDDTPPVIYTHSLKRLLPYVKAYPFALVGALLAVIVAAVAVLGMGSGVRLLIDHGFTHNNANWLKAAVFILFLTVVLMSGASYARLFLVSHLSERIIADIRQKIFENLLNHNISFFEKTSVGEIQSRLTTDTTLLHIVMGTSFPVAVRNILIMFGGMIMLVTTSIKLTLLILLIIPLVIIPIIILGKKVKKFSQQAQAKTAAIASRLDETLSFIRVVIAFCREHYVMALFNNHVEEAYQMSMQRVKARALLTAFVMILIFGSLNFVLWVGGQAVISGTMTAGELSSFLFYAVAVAGSAASFSEIYGDILRASGAMERISEYLFLNNDNQTYKKRLKLPKSFKGAIEFKNVNFSYPTRSAQWVLKDVSFSIKPGETVALVGPSGVGKTTIFNLLIGLYPLSSGQIMLDDHDLTHLDLFDVRKHISWVPQEAAIFSTSIKENIRFGRLEASKDDIYQAAVAAHADEFIQYLPDGYSTYVGERGVTLSGGQRQRIAIARAILRNSHVLLLDEATSALDSESESKIQMALAGLIKNRTTLIIAHRLSTIQNADKIIVLEKGRVVSMGTHKQLLAEKGLYYRLIAKQFEKITP